jgi:hypothetical protein
MKNITIDADNLLIILSFALLIAIFFNLLFGCTYTKPRESFNNKPDDKKEESDETKKSSASTPSVPSTPPSTPSAPSTPPSTIPTETVKLSKFEQEIKEGLENGTLKAEDVIELAKAEKFTQVNVKNIMKDIASRMS